MKKDLILLYKLIGKRGLQRLLFIVLFGVLVGFLEMISVMMVPIMIKFLNNDEVLLIHIRNIKHYLNEMPLDNFNCFIFIFLILFTVKFVVSFFYYRTHSAFLQKTHFVIINKLFNGITNLSYSEYKKQAIADITKTVTIDSYELTQRVLVPLLVIITETITIVFLLALIFAYNYKFFLISATILFGIFSAYKKLAKNHIEKIGIDKAKADKQIIGIVNDYMNLYKEIKLHSFDEKYKKLFSFFNRLSSKSFQKLHFSNQVPRLLLEYIGVLAIIFSIIFVLDVRSNDFLPFISLVVLVTFRMLPLVNRVTNSFNDLSFGKNIIANFYTKNSKIFQKPSLGNFVFSKYMCKNLSISIGGKEIIKKLNFSFRKNEIIAIVGKSGSGKSTLVDFMMGFITNSGGSCLINGKNYKNVISAFRNVIHYVPQDTYLINGSIINNISLFDSSENKNLGKINYLLDRLNLREVSNRLRNKNLGDTGKKISGGEKQRIGIARALYTSPQVLILDEATSALDRYNQNIVLNFLKDLSRDVTIVFITHRQETLSFANQIIKISE